MKEREIKKKNENKCECKRNDSERRAKKKNVMMITINNGWPTIVFFAPLSRIDMVCMSVINIATDGGSNSFLRSFARSFCAR